MKNIEFKIDITLISHNIEIYVLEGIVQRIFEIYYRTIPSNEACISL